MSLCGGIPLSRWVSAGIARVTDDHHVIVLLGVALRQLVALETPEREGQR